MKTCKEASCLAELGRKVNADYVAQARIGRFGENLTIKTELYDSRKGNLMGSFTGSSKDIYGLLALIDEKAADALFKKMPGVSGGSNAPFVAGGISGVESTGGSYEVNYEKSYLVNISTDPAGAALSFNGVPIASCTKTPCKAELSEGSIRIVAALEQYEMADTIVSVRQNNQSVTITLKSNFGILDIKPAYSDGIGASKGWSLIINGKGQSSYENRLSPGNYEVKLGHECYEDISFKVGINKGSREVFDMFAHIKLKNGGLILKAELNGEPLSEPVYVNGKQLGETPFSGTVPLCAEIELGKNRERVDVVLKYNEKVTHTVKNYGYKSSSSAMPAVAIAVPAVPAVSAAFSFKDTRDNKTYKITKIGKQTWMAENLNYNASGSKCYSNQESNCQKYGRLYNWNTAKTACPNGWHLPNDAEWDVLMKSVNPSCSPKANCANAGKLLKATSGWNSNGNGTDALGFSALPGGYGISVSFSNVGDYGYWWSASEGHGNYANGLRMYYNNGYVDYSNIGKFGLYFSVRCLQD